jgi:hypothetical protein
MRKQTLTALIASFVLSAGCATTMVQEDVQIAPTSPIPVRCKITLPNTTSLPTSLYDDFRFPRTNLLLSGRHEGVDLESNTPEVRVLRGGRLGIYDTQDSNADQQHRFCLRVIVNEDLEIEDIYCGFDQQTNVPMGSRVQSGQILGTALPTSNGYVIHYGVHETRRTTIGTFSIYHNPNLVLRQANGCQ